MGLIATGSKRAEKKDVFAPSSKFIATVEYDPEGRTMDITFKSGTKVRYLQVYPSTFLSFKRSPTHDSYYARGIKENLPSTKLIENTIGRTKSTPLQKAKKEKDLNDGLKRQQAELKRINGTIARAFATL